MENLFISWTFFFCNGPYYLLRTVLRAVIYEEVYNSVTFRLETKYHGTENDLHVCGIIFETECAANYNLVEFPVE